MQISCSSPKKPPNKQAARKRSASFPPSSTSIFSFLSRYYENFSKRELRHEFTGLAVFVSIASQQGTTTHKKQSGARVVLEFSLFSIPCLRLPYFFFLRPLSAVYSAHFHRAPSSFAGSIPGALFHFIICPARAVGLWTLIHLNISRPAARAGVIRTFDRSLSVQQSRAACLTSCTGSTRNFSKD